MKVKDFIKQLQKYNNPDDDIIGVYWAYDDVSDGELSDNNWKELVRRFDNHSFQQDCDDIFNTLIEIKEDNKQYGQ
tara:strand:+ start:759 stop:986 length:228 start_codon:yes stop_codon:yes gene_type:complete